MFSKTFTRGKCPHERQEPHVTEPKSIKTTNLNENDLKLLESVCDFDQRLYQYFIENKLVNKY